MVDQADCYFFLTKSTDCVPDLFAPTHTDTREEDNVALVAWRSGVKAR